ncbi:MAG: hypothetical protein IJV00_01535 [Clostridia bacterium]|nr:hypothetical protein [Clostridia bacterium]
MKKLFAALIAALTILTSGCTAPITGTEKSTSAVGTVPLTTGGNSGTRETTQPSPLPAPSAEQIEANKGITADFLKNDRGINGETLTVFEAEPYSFEEAFEKAEAVKETLITHGFVYNLIELMAGNTRQAKLEYGKSGVIEYLNQRFDVETSLHAAALSINKWGKIRIPFGYGENYPDIAALTGKNDPGPEDKKTLVKAAKEMLKCYFPQRSELNRSWSDVKTEEDGDLVKVTFYSAPQSENDTFSSTVPETVVTFTTNSYDLRLARNGEKIMIKSVEFNELKGSFAQKNAYSTYDAWLNALRNDNLNTSCVVYGCYIGYPTVDSVTATSQKADFAPYFVFLISNHNSNLTRLLKTAATREETYLMIEPTQEQKDLNSGIVEEFALKDHGVKADRITVITPEIFSYSDAQKVCRKIVRLSENNGWTKKDSVCASEDDGTDPESGYYDTGKMVLRGKTGKEVVAFTKWGVLTYTWENAETAPNFSLLTGFDEPDTSNEALYKKAAENLMKGYFSQIEKMGSLQWTRVETEYDGEYCRVDFFYESNGDRFDPLTCNRCVFTNYYPEFSVTFRIEEKSDGGKNAVLNSFSFNSFTGASEDLEKIPVEKAWDTVCTENAFEIGCVVYDWFLSYPELPSGCGKPDMKPYYTFLYSLRNETEAHVITSPAVNAAEYSLPEPSESQKEQNKTVTEQFDASGSGIKDAETVCARFALELSYEQAKELCDRITDIYVREGWAKKETLVPVGDDPEGIYYDLGGTIFVEDLDSSLEIYGEPTGAARPIISVDNIGEIRLVWEYGELSPRISELCTAGDGKTDVLNEKTLVNVAENFLKKYFPDFLPGEREEYLFNKDDVYPEAYVSGNCFSFWFTENGFNNKAPDGEKMVIYEINLGRVNYRTYKVPVIGLEEAWKKASKVKTQKEGEPVVYSYYISAAEEQGQSSIPKYVFLCSNKNGTETFTLMTDAVRYNTTRGYYLPD